MFCSVQTTFKRRHSHACVRVCVGVCVYTSVSLEGGDQAAVVLLQLQDGHLTRLVPYKGVSGLHIKPEQDDGQRTTNC